MFVDSSAVVAIINGESGFEALVERIANERAGLYVSPLVRYEAVVAIARNRTATGEKPARLNAEIVRQANELVERLFVETAAQEVAISKEIGVGALKACAKYGKAAGHPASLNFGDCFAYACAKSLGVGLLYEGDDFAETDLA